MKQIKKSRINIVSIIAISMVVMAGVLAFTPETKNTSGSSANSEKNGNIVTLTDFNFKSETNKGLILVDFWAPWCSPCRRIAPILEEIASEMQGSITIGKLNVDDHQKYPQQFGIQGIPTMILFKDGKEVKRFVGLQSKDILKAEIKKFEAK